MTSISSFSSWMPTIYFIAGVCLFFLVLFIIFKFYKSYPIGEDYTDAK